MATRNFRLFKGSRRTVNAEEKVEPNPPPVPKVSVNTPTFTVQAQNVVPPIQKTSNTVFVKPVASSAPPVQDRASFSIATKKKPSVERNYNTDAILDLINKAKDIKAGGDPRTIREILKESLVEYRQKAQQ